MPFWFASIVVLNLVLHGWVAKWYSWICLPGLVMMLYIILWMDRALAWLTLKQFQTGVGLLLAVTSCTLLTMMCSGDERTVISVFLFQCFAMHNNIPAAVRVVEARQGKLTLRGALANRLLIVVACAACLATLVGLVAGMRLRTLDTLLVSRVLGDPGGLASLSGGSVFLSAATSQCVQMARLLWLSARNPLGLAMHSGRWTRTVKATSERRLTATAFRENGAQQQLQRGTGPLFSSQSRD